MFSSLFSKKQDTGKFTFAKYFSLTNLYSKPNVANASDGIQIAAYPWSHAIPWQPFDHRSIRRGFQVYQQICASCHSLNLVAYRTLVNVAFTEDEVKEMAAEVDVEDGPDDSGEMFTRPGRLTDFMPKPYPNEQAARAANNGAYPVDLSLIVKARPGFENYIFSLLTGYMDAPTGYDVKPGMSYNPYFYGSQIAMPQQLKAGAVTYDDGTDASISQMAKDVTNFLAWASEPHQDSHRLAGIKVFFLLSFTVLTGLYYKRMKWTTIKKRYVSFINTPTK